MISDFFAKNSKSRKKLQEWYYQKHIPRSIADNFVALDGAQIALLRRSLLENTFPPEVSSEAPEVQYHTELLAVRFRNHRAQIIPWLNWIKPLSGLRILEIGRPLWLWSNRGRL